MRSHEIPEPCSNPHVPFSPFIDPATLATLSSSMLHAAPISISQSASSATRAIAYLCRKTPAGVVIDTLHVEVALCREMRDAAWHPPILFQLRSRGPPRVCACNERCVEDLTVRRKLRHHIVSSREIHGLDRRHCTSSTSTLRLKIYDDLFARSSSNDAALRNRFY